jgi:hypothetical protein
VIGAVRDGRFHVWAIETIDEGIALLSGTLAGDLDQEGTFHHRLEQRLQEMLDILEEQPTPAISTRVRQAATTPPKPVPPPLPGDDRSN